jgi:hypothetical protein
MGEDWCLRGSAMGQPLELTWLRHGSTISAWLSPWVNDWCLHGSAMGQLLVLAWLRHGSTVGACLALVLAWLRRGFTISAWGSSWLKIGACMVSSWVNGWCLHGSAMGQRLGWYWLLNLLSSAIYPVPTFGGPFFIYGIKPSHYSMDYEFFPSPRFPTPPSCTFVQMSD